MDTIIERDVHTDRNDTSSAMASIVGIIAILAIVGIGMYILRIYPMNSPANTAQNPVNINVNIPASSAAQ